MTLGERLARLRNQKGLSQDALAEALGVSRQSVSKWETDASIPELDKLVRLSGLFGVSLDELVSGSSPAVPAPSSNIGTVWKRFAALYREKAYLLGWLLVVWGVLGLLHSIQTVFYLHAKTGLVDIVKYLQMTSYLYISHTLKIVLGLLAVFRGRHFSGQFRWYYLGWLLIVLGVFGCRPIRLLQSSPLEDLLAVFLVYLPYYGPAKAQEFLALWPENLGNILLCILGLLILVLGRRIEKTGKCRN